MRRLLVAAAAVVLTLTTAPGLTTGARAATPSPSPGATSSTADDDVLVSITTAAEQPDGTLEVDGTVNARATVHAATLELFVGDALITRTDLHDLQDTDDVSSFTRTTSDLGDLAPASGTPFHLTAPGRLRDESVTPVRVAVTGLDSKGRTVDAGGLTTVVPSFQAVAPGALQTAWVIPLTSQPLLSPDGTLSDSTRTELTSDLRGRLSVPLAAAEAVTPNPAAAMARTPVTLAVDPALLESVQLMAGETTTPTGTKDGGTTDQQAAAQSWLIRLRTDVRLPSVTVAALPYADVDLGALARANDDDDRTAAVGRASDDVATALDLSPDSVEADLLVPADGQIGSAALATEVSDRTRLAVLSDATLPPVPAARTPGSLTRLTVDGRTLPTLVTDGAVENLVQTGDGGTGGAVAAQAVRRFAAELAQTVAEAPNATPVRGLVIVAPRDWTASADFATGAVESTTSGAFATPAALTDLVAGTATVREALVDVDPGALPAQVVTDVQAGKTKLDALRSLLPSPSGISGTEQAPDPSASATPSPSAPATTTEASDPIVTPLARALLRGLSSWWQVDPDAGATQRAAVKQRIADRLASVRIGVSHTVLLTGEQGKLPVQIANGLPAQITVRLTLQSVDGNRLETVTQDVTVAAASGTSATNTQVSLPLKSRTSGRFPATVTLSTTSGALLGDPTPLVVRVGGLGGIALVITAGALGLLAVLVLRRGVRTIRRQRMGLSGAGS